MSTNHPRYNARVRRSFAEAMRVIEALQAGQSILIERHANGLRIRHPQTDPPRVDATQATAPPASADAASQTPSGSN